VALHNLLPSTLRHMYSGYVSALLFCAFSIVQQLTR